LRVQPAHFVLTVAVRRWENGFNGILADEVGLGRTTQPIGMLAHLWAHEARKPHTRIAAMHPRTVHVTHLKLDCASRVRGSHTCNDGCQCAASDRLRQCQSIVGCNSVCATAPFLVVELCWNTAQHVCNTARHARLQHRSTKCCNTGQLSVAGVWAVPHRRTPCSHARLVQSVQEAHARYAVHDLPRHVRLIAWQRTLLPVTVCSDFAHTVAALQRMAAAAGSKADRAALVARYLKHLGRKTFPVVRVHPSAAQATSQRLTRFARE
jgi:hypothetical protein